jgi:hypothetical protein
MNSEKGIRKAKGGFLRAAAGAAVLIGSKGPVPRPQNGIGHQNLSRLSEGVPT